MSAKLMWKLGPLVIVRWNSYRAFGVTMPTRWRFHWLPK